MPVTGPSACACTRLPWLTRRHLLAALAGIAVSRHAAAQTSGKAWRIGIIDTASAEMNAANLAAFRRGLRELG